VNPETERGRKGKSEREKGVDEFDIVTPFHQLEGQN
jgi:hypothetical protein